jgi:putative membrane protein (TIGR04086 family)
MKRVWIDMQAVLTAGIVMLILSAAAGALFYVTALPESLMRPLGAVFLAAGALLGGARAGKKFGRRGWAHGLRIGLLLLLILAAYTVVSGVGAPSLNGLARAAGCVLPAAIIGSLWGTTRPDSGEDLRHLLR